MTKMTQRNKTDEKGEVIDTSMTSEFCCSATMSDGRVVSQCYGFVIMLGGAGATCPT